MSNVPPEPTDIVVEDDGNANRQPSRRSKRIRRAIIVSIVAHVIGVIALLFWYVPQIKSQPQKAAAASDSSSASLPPSTPPPPSMPTAQPADDVPSAEVQRSLESQIEAVEKLPDERKLNELEKNLKRLESVSNPDSVEDVAAKITSSLGLDSQQYAPKDPAEIPGGDIDLEKAQLSDVTRTRNEQGGWDYVSTLVDNQGRELKVPVSVAEGEAMYETFQQMKKFPMAAGIYRSVVMPMMQKMIEASELAEELSDEAAADAERVNGEDDGVLFQ